MYCLKLYKYLNRKCVISYDNNVLYDILRVYHVTNLSANI